MRPVHRGIAPGVYARYQDAINDLEERLGTYCSYCERRLPTSLAVEHVNPKSVSPGLETVWTNFLLGCTNCNSVKGAKPTNDTDFLWPDRDNTLLAFAYREGGFVETHPHLTGPLREQADALKDVVGLDRHRGLTNRRPAPRDKRWKDREQVWALAVKWRDRVAQFPSAQRATVRELIVDAAVGYGFFSVWMEVFRTDKDVRKGLVRDFAGTAPDCFDAQGSPISRAAGRI
jgi:uncharacterized protein (TIGR02646 family)